METIPTVSEMSGVESQSDPVFLRTPVILRRILEHFSNSQLLQLSLVNKEWNFEARSVLRDRGNLMLKNTTDLCQKVVAIASDLKKMRVVPFSGIEYLIYHSEPCHASQEEPLDPYYNDILDRLQWRQVNVTFFAVSANNHDCPGFAFLKKILDGFSDALENVLLSFGTQEGVEWFQGHLINWSFSRLQILELELNYPCTAESSTDFVKTLVSSAPNLKELRWVENFNFKTNVLEGSSAVFVPSDFNPLYQEVCETLIRSLRLEAIKFYVDQTEDYEKELFNELVPKVLHASHTSLNILGMDLLVAVPLMCYGICLENVTTLKIRTSTEFIKSLEQRTSTILKGFDFARIFPKLTQVRILNGYHPMDYEPPHHRPRFVSAADISGFVQRGNAVVQNTLPDRANNIKHLILRKYTWETSVNSWAQMFPHVKTLSVETEGIKFPFDELLNYFGNLEELNVTWNSRCQFRVANLDSAFCGIFPAEISELRGKDDEYLKPVNIVPVMPSVCCMRGLRSLTCTYTPEKCWKLRTDSTLIFSKVTALIGFARCPSLTVTLEANSKTAEELRHMEPYVTFIVKDSFTDYDSDDED